MYAPNISMVGTRPAGGGALFPLGSLATITGLTWSDAYPGGNDTLSLTLQLDPSRRDASFDPGRRVEVHRGASVVWEGRLTEPTPNSEGWTISAKGRGGFGDSYRAIWSTWNANDAVNQAITRGLRWKNPGIPSGVYLAEQQDSGSQNITDFLTLITKAGGYGWHVGRRGVLTVAPLPVTVTRVLMSGSPQARSLAGYLNVLYARYQATLDDSANGTAATYGLASAVNQPSADKHGRQESYWDITGASVISSGTAAGYAATALSQYQAASWAGPIPFSYGQYLTPTGVPVDPGCEMAGEVVRLMLTDGPYGGEVSPSPPVTFIAGKIDYDDETGGGAVTPYQSVAGDLGTLMGELALTLPKPSVSGG